MRAYFDAALRLCRDGELARRLFVAVAKEGGEVRAAGVVEGKQQRAAGRLPACAVGKAGGGMESGT